MLKTTISVNLAGLYAKMGKKVLIVDMDSQGNVLLSFGKNPDNYELTIRDLLLKRSIHAVDVAVEIHPNITVIPANDDFGDFEFNVINNSIYQNPFHLLRNSIAHYANQFDIVIVDTPPSFGLIQGNALLMADYVIIPFQPESYSMRSLVKLTDTLDLFKEQFNSKLEIVGIVPTMVDMRTSLHAEIMEVARKFCREYNLPMTDTIIPKTIRYASDIGFNKLPTTLLTNRKTSEPYEDLFVELREKMYSVSKT